jgi:hypothetical protein
LTCRGVIGGRGMRRAKAGEDFDIWFAPPRVVARVCPGEKFGAKLAEIMTIIARW